MNGMRCDEKALHATYNWYIVSVVMAADRVHSVHDAPNF